MRLKINSAAPSPQGPVIGCEADTSASSTVGVPVAATAKKIGPTSAVQARSSFSARSRPDQRALEKVEHFGNPSGRGVAIDCLSSSISRENLGSSFASQKIWATPGRI